MDAGQCIPFKWSRRLHIVLRTHQYTLTIGSYTHGYGVLHSMLSTISHYDSRSCEGAMGLVVVCAAHGLPVIVDLQWLPYTVCSGHLGWLQRTHLPSAATRQQVQTVACLMLVESQCNSASCCLTIVAQASRVRMMYTCILGILGMLA
jgi:hypothetical protein